MLRPELLGELGLRTGLHGLRGAAAELRLLRDERSASDVGAPVLLVSQFTLYGDARKGRRPTWAAAAPGEVSEPLYEAVCEELMDGGGGGPLWCWETRPA